MVSGTSTQNGGPSPLDYDYVYDYLWRILRAGPPASDSWGEKGISYDWNGSLTFREIGSHQSFESSLFGGGVILSDGVRYFTRDHLGNTRVVTDGSGNVVERNDYYPFGERHSDSSMPTTATNRWRFAGKEIQPLGSTGWIDFGARQYDSFLGRWTTVDPLAEKYPGFSPYLYCAGNPVNFVDRSGQFPETLWDIANVVMDVKSLATNIAVGNVGGAIVDGIGLIADVASVALPGVPGGAGTAIKAARGGDLAVDAIRAADKAEKAVSAGKYGSYTITFESGKKYHGKGPVSRMEQSAREKSKKFSDPVVSKDWVPSPTERDAFIDEAFVTMVVSKVQQTII